MQSAFYRDGAAIALSTVCIIHCAALPVLAVSSPFIAVLSEAEWVHWVMAILAILASISVVVFSPSSRVAQFLVPAGLGGSLIVASLFAEQFGFEETLPTILGGILIATAHTFRIYKAKWS